MKHLLLIVFISLNTYHLQAQNPIEWHKAYGGSGSEVCSDIQATSDGGYIIIGITQSNDGDVSGHKGQNDIWVAKLTASGAISWQKCYGGTMDELGWGSIQQTNDGGYIFVAYTNSNNGDVTLNKGKYDIWVVKLTATGTISWQKCLGGDEDDRIAYGQIIKTADGGYALIGYTSSNNSGDVVGNHSANSDVWIYKMKANGDMHWRKCYGGVSGDRGYGITQTIDGGYIACASAQSTDGDLTNNKGGQDMWFFKTDSVGNIQWQKNYGGSKDDVPYRVLQTGDGGYIAVGTTASTDGDVTGHHDSLDIWVLKLNNTGGLVWQRAIGGKRGDDAKSVIIASDGTYIIAGSSTSNDGDISGVKGSNDIWLMGLNTDGSTKWTGVFGGTKSENNSMIRQLSDGSFIVACTSTSTDGDADGNGNHGGADIWVVKLRATLGINGITNANSVAVYPTVTNGKVFVNLPTGHEQAEIKVVNIFGRLVDAVTENNGLNRTVYLSNVPAGTYLLQVINKGEVHSTKIVYQQ